MSSYSHYPDEGMDHHNKYVTSASLFAPQHGQLHGGFAGLCQGEDHSGAAAQKHFLLSVFTEWIGKQIEISRGLSRAPFTKEDRTTHTLKD